jgi:hypothetical protein
VNNAGRGKPFRTSVISSAGRHPSEQRFAACDIGQLRIERHIAARGIDPNEG